MGHEGHHHEPKETLSFFKSPLHEHGHATTHHDHVSSSHSSDIEAKPVDPRVANSAPFENQDCEIHDSPSFHRHAEATTAELFYDLFFVANLTTFTANLEINDNSSLKAYVGFFCLLWLTWYQVTLYDVRFSTDSVFERVAKAIHFGVMVGFAIMGVEWKVGQYVAEYHIYKAFGYVLLVSRITLFLQYGVTLFYTKKYRKTVVPIALVMGFTLLAAILYGALTPAFPKEEFTTDVDEFGYYIPKLQKSNVYIAWYIIGVCETALTVAVSCHWRIISFKGTHMVQRMSLLTLIILGEGIIVICKSISKVIKNDYQWTPAVTGQVVGAVLIIYFLYMLYFDRMHEEHFGTIKQQIWSFSHFPLHVVFVLVLQGVSLLIVWRQAVIGLTATFNDMSDMALNRNFTDGTELYYHMNQSAYLNVFNYVPKGVDDEKSLKLLDQGLTTMALAWDSVAADATNETAIQAYSDGFSVVYSACVKTLFDSLSVSVSKKQATKLDKNKDADAMLAAYVNVFELVYTYVFIAVSAFY